MRCSNACFWSFLNWPVSGVLAVWQFFWIVSLSLSSCYGSETGHQTEKSWNLECKNMVDVQIARRQIKDKRVLAAMESIPRHLFVPQPQRFLAYEDTALPIGHGQTISQPYIVAYMSEALELKPTDRVLEIGTGSGYQAAVLSRLVKDVYSIEIVDALAKEAEKRLEELGFTNVHLSCGDGYRGWPEAAPFDAIILTAAPAKVPLPLLEQLKVGGRMVLPVGTTFQSIKRIRSSKSGLKEEELIPVRFVPMTGEAQKQK